MCYNQKYCKATNCNQPNPDNCPVSKLWDTHNDVTPSQARQKQFTENCLAIGLHNAMITLAQYKPCEN